MAKFASLIVLTVLVAVCSGASFGGVKDIVGNYYDFTTGQYASALTGKVYNTAPVAYASPVAPVVAAPAVAPYYYNAAPYVAPYAAPYAYSYGPAAYVAPFWKK